MFFSERGFSVLESIIAIVILVSVGAALLGVMSSRIANVEKLQDSLRADAITPSILDMIEVQVNRGYLTGSHRVNFHQVNWKIINSANRRDIMNLIGQRTNRSALMYDIHVTVVSETTGYIREFETKVLAVD